MYAQLPTPKKEVVYLTNAQHQNADFFLDIKRKSTPKIIDYYSLMVLGDLLESSNARKGPKTKSV